MKVISYIFKSNYLRNEQRVLLLFYISIALGIIIHYLAKLSGPVMVLSVLASFFSGFAGIFLFMATNRTSHLSKWLIFILVYLLIVGISYGSFNPFFRGGGDFSRIITSDLRFIMYVIIGSILATDRYIGYYHQVMRFLAIWAVLLGVAGILSTDFNLRAVTERELAWDFGYYSWWLSASICHYWGFYSIVSKKEKLLGYSVLLVYLLLGILFLKRAAVVNVFAILIIANFISNKSKMLFIWRLAGVGMFFILTIWLLNIIGAQVVTVAVNQLSQRFSALDDLEQFDRQIEGTAYFDNATNKQVLLGNGIGHYPPLYIYGWDRDRLSALHIGYYNIVFKGGLLLALFYFLALVGVLKRLFWFSRLTRYEKVCLGIALSLFISLLYEASWAYTLTPFGVYPTLFYLLRKRDNKALTNEQI